MLCPNCGTQAPAGIGFGSICMKFKTFVCDLCKTSHQAISHRVKSISMSTWTLDEVYSLEDKNSGGNEACRFIWLNNAPPYGGRYSTGQRPKAGDRVEIFKQFIIDCYESGMFKANQPYIANTSVRNNSKPLSTDKKQAPPINNTAKVEADLLGWDDPNPSTSQNFTSKNSSKSDTHLFGFSDNPLPSSTTMRSCSHSNGDFADFSNMSTTNVSMSSSFTTTNAPSKSSDFLDLLSNIDIGTSPTITNSTSMSANNGLSKYIDPFASTSAPMLTPNNFAPPMFPHNNFAHMSQQPQLAQPYNTMMRGNMMTNQQNYGTPYIQQPNLSAMPAQQNNNMINTHPFYTSANSSEMISNSSLLQQNKNSSNDVFGFISQELKSSVQQKK